MIFKSSFVIGEALFDTLKKIHREDAIQEITERYQKKEFVEYFWKKYNFLLEFKDSVYLDHSDFYQFYKQYFFSTPPSTYFSEFNKEAQALSFLTESTGISAEFSLDDFIAVLDMINRLLLFEDEFFGERQV